MKDINSIQLIRTLAVIVSIGFAIIWYLIYTSSKRERKGWKSVYKSLPEQSKLVWLLDEQGYVYLGSLSFLMPGTDVFHWCIISGVPYVNDGFIGGDCVPEDVNITAWQDVPKLPLR